MKYYLLIVFFCVQAAIFAQGEANYWYFGQNAGLNFGTTPPTVLTDGALNTLEGCTTISDPNGDLLFYTDGINVYNRNHIIMPNGTGLKGDPSSTSSALVVPQPNTPNIFLIFTVDEPHHLNADGNPNTIDGDGVNDGLMYSVVDMSLDGGNGAVIATQKNMPLVTYDPTNPREEAYRCSEKITAVKSDNCDSFWVITHFTHNFYAFEVNNAGVNATPVISNVGVDVPIEGYRRNALGYIKASPEGDKLAVAHLGLTNLTGGNGPGKVLLYNFDNVTGTVSNEVELYDGDAPYGVEFSPSGERLYATIGLGDSGANGSILMQYDLSLPDAQIAASGDRIANQTGQTTSSFSAGAIQLAPDGKIYRALYDFSSGNGDFLGVIENPETLAAGIIYSDNSLRINIDGRRGSRIGLPPFIQSLFAESIDIINDPDLTANDINLNLCDGETYTLSFNAPVGSTFEWYLNDILIPGETTNSLIVTTAGNYRLEVDFNDGSCPSIGAANVTYFNIPSIAATPSLDETCIDQNIGIEQSTLDSFITIIRGTTQNATDVDISFYQNQTDADMGTNAITAGFIPTSNVYSLFTRIENTANTDCYNTTSFFIYITPEAFNVDTVIECDNADDGDDTNGQISFNLRSLDTQIYQTQNSNDFDIDYYTTLNGAQNEIATDLITNPASATISTNIFARIYNAANTNCFDTIEIPVQIESLPEAIDTTLVQCDIDTNPTDGLTAFNLNEAIPSLTNNNTNVTVSFAEDMTFSNRIANPQNYTNTANGQIIYARVQDNMTNCFRDASVTLNTLVVTVSNVTHRHCDDDGTEDGLFTFDILDIQNTILNTLSIPTGAIVAIYENESDAILEQNELTTSYINTIPNNQVIYARIENNNNCFGISEITLIVDALPNIETEGNTFLCENESTILNPGLLEGNLTDFTYLWSTGETSPSITVTSDGTYSVTVTNANGCQKDRNITVTLSNPATIDVIDIVDVSDNNTVTINASGLGDYEYAIEFNGQQPVVFQDSNVFTNVPPGFHRVLIRDKNGCLPLTIQDIVVVGFPKFFTPNGDSFNDTWNVKGVSSTHLGNSLIYIFDRYGKLIKQISPLGNGWDGTYNSRPMPSSSYWYRVELEDGRLLKGSFVLKR
ncbi:T9SS type B sorting domain-containing protein [Aquimarina rhabdastrellae]